MSRYILTPQNFNREDNLLVRASRRERNFVNYPASVSVSERQRAQADAGIRKFSIRASSSVADRASHQSDCLKASQDW